MMSDVRTIAADLERCVRRVEDARSTYTLACHHMRSLSASDVLTAQRDHVDIALNRLMNERAEHARLVAEMVGLAEGVTE
jgi:chorismate mutase